jgi:hypothetical protein
VNGGTYEQLREDGPEPWESLPSELREYLSAHGVRPPAKSEERVVPPALNVAAEKVVQRALEIAIRDGRNNAGFWLASQLRDNGFVKTVLRRNSWEGAIHAALLKTTNSVLVAAIR